MGFDSIDRVHLNQQPNQSDYPMKSLKDIPVRYVKGVGPAKMKLLGQLGIESVEDLFYFFPRRYEDRRNLTPIATLKVGEAQAITGKIVVGSGRRSWYTKKHVTQITVDDDSGKISCVWFNRPYLNQYLKAGQRIVCFGKVGVYKEQLQLSSPEYEVIDSEEDESLSLKRIVPVYSLTKGVTQRYLRKIISACLEKYKEDLRDELPVALRNKHKIANIKRSIANIHFPEEFKDQETALHRISFEEFFFFQVSVLLRRLSITHKNGFAHAIGDDLVMAFDRNFPFELTGAQKRVTGEIRADMQAKAPMLRLLQGDVGSGKTLVAVFGCIAAFKNGNQSCVMAPTEILARQHFENITQMVGKGPFKDIKVAMLTSGLSNKEREGITKEIKDGAVDLVIGTHALITDQTEFRKLSFAVVDEQHKFGVRQRALLSAKGDNPDVLIMTATPIPRTLCMTLYGDLDVSVIDEMPPGRGAVKTALHTFEEEREVYKAVRKRIEEGRQAYIIYPVIDESGSADLKAAKNMFKRFRSKEFKEFRVGLVHGQMKQQEAREAMQKFKDRELDILVATTIVEVGMDVPNASIMVIEHAENFGLAQLHQLRGRIGRGSADSECYLIADAQSQDAAQRLDAVLSTNDGFKIAEADLKIRGPGRFFGRHQHGLNELKVADPLTQLDILELARREAELLTKEDPKLSNEANRPIMAVIKERYPTYLRDVLAG